MYAMQGMHIPVVDAQLRYRNTISHYDSEHRFNTFRKCKRLLALEQIIFTCVLHLRSSSMVTPSNLKECTCSTILLLKDNIKRSTAPLVTMAISFVFDKFIFN